MYGIILKSGTRTIAATIGFACIMLTINALLFQKTAIDGEKEGYGKFFLVSVGIGSYE